MKFTSSNILEGEKSLTTFSSQHKSSETQFGACTLTDVKGKKEGKITVLLTGGRTLAVLRVFTVYFKFISPAIAFPPSNTAHFLPFP